jgi:hypothetical protein
VVSQIIYSINRIKPVLVSTTLTRPEFPEPMDDVANTRNSLNTMFTPFMARGGIYNIVTVTIELRGCYHVVLIIIGGGETISRT